MDAPCFGSDGLCSFYCYFSYFPLDKAANETTCGMNERAHIRGIMAQTLARELTF